MPSLACLNSSSQRSVSTRQTCITVTKHLFFIDQHQLAEYLSSIVILQLRAISFYITCTIPPPSPIYYLFI